MLTGVLDWLLGINVNRSLARPIYATTPLTGCVEDFHLRVSAPCRAHEKSRFPRTGTSGSASCYVTGQRNSRRPTAQLRKRVD
ncbi:MAG: hypothetical protein VB124_01210 [Burkholderia sp.]